MNRTRFCSLCILSILHAFAFRQAAFPQTPEIDRIRSFVKDKDPFTFDVLEGSDIVALARRPKVAEWIRARITQVANEYQSWTTEEALLYDILLAAGPVADDVKLVSWIGKSYPQTLKYFVRPLLERAPFSLSGAIENGLLGPIVEGAADLDTEMQNALWLAAHRFPLGNIRTRMKAASSRFDRPDYRPSAYGRRAALIEVLLLGADGRPIETPAYASVFGTIVWPDGKIRFKEPRPIRSGVCQPKVVGYRVPAGIPIDLEEAAALRHTLILTPRFRMKGKLVPPPKIPLSAALVEAVPFGRRSTDYTADSRACTVPVRNDGTFWVPIHSKGKLLVVSTMNGDILLSKPAVPPLDQDQDLGVVPMPPTRDLITVSVFTNWCKGAVSEEVFDLFITWKPKDPEKKPIASQPARFRIPLQAGRFRVGTARNMPPGEYETEVTFKKAGPQVHGELQPIKIDFTVGRPIVPLVLEPQLK